MTLTALFMAKQALEAQKSEVIVERDQKLGAIYNEILDLEAEMAALRGSDLAEKIRLGRRQRRVKGLCADQGCGAVSGASYRCPKHTEEYTMRVRKFRKARL